MYTSVVIAVTALAGLSMAAPSGNVNYFGKRACFGGELAPISDSQRCADYLISLGTQTCESGGNWNQICGDGDAHVWGRAGDGGYASSYCRDVGYGIQGIINSCRAGSFTSGQSTAGGNGNYIIELSGGGPF